AGQNYGVCFEVLPSAGSSHVVLSKDVKSNYASDGATELTNSAVSFSTGWYEVVIDWQATNPRISVSVYNSSGTLFASLSSNDTTYTSSGGVGFTFWGQHGGWDTYMVKPYTAVTPTYLFGSEQASGGATWKAAEDTAVTGIEPNQNIRLRFSIQNTGSPLTNALYQLQSAPMGSSLNCEAVLPQDFSNVPTSYSCGSAIACM